MPMWLINLFESQNSPTTLLGNEHGEMPVDDPAPMDHPAEQYESWRATAIFSLSPFSAPPGR